MGGKTVACTTYLNQEICALLRDFVLALRSTSTLPCMQNTVDHVMLMNYTIWEGGRNLSDLTPRVDLPYPLHHSVPRQIFKLDTFFLIFATGPTWFTRWIFSDFCRS
jgi:hypothetical protein